MLWLQSLASFTEDHGRGKVTAFLDRAASLCSFLAVCLVCRTCLDRGSVCRCLCARCQTEQVFQQNWKTVCLLFCLCCNVSCPLPYSRLSPPPLRVFSPVFVVLKAFIISHPLFMFHSFTGYFFHLTSCKSLQCCYQQHRKLLFPLHCKLTSIYLMTRGKTPDVNSSLHPSLSHSVYFPAFLFISFLPQSDNSVWITEPACSRH